MNSYIWLPLALLLGFAGIVGAQPLPGPRPMPVPFQRPAVQPINPGSAAAATLREGIDKLLGFLGKEEKPNKLQLAAFLDGTIAPYFDFAYMAKWVAGPRYAAMSDKQRNSLAASLEARFLGTLASRLANYKGQKVRYLRPRRGPRGAVTVPVGILRAGSYPAKLEFRMYRSGDGWKVYDVVANGQSAVAFFRRQSQQSQVPRRPVPYGR